MSWTSFLKSNKEELNAVWLFDSVYLLFKFNILLASVFYLLKFSKGVYIFDFLMF